MVGVAAQQPASSGPGGMAGLEADQPASCVSRGTTMWSGGGTVRRQQTHHLNQVWIFSWASVVDGGPI